MKTNNFLASGFAGGIVYFLLGWLFYGILLIDFFPSQENAEEMQTMLMIFLGCLSYALFIAYIYTKWAQISTLGTGAKAGALIGLFMGLTWNFFAMAMPCYPDYNWSHFGADVIVMIISSAITGAVIAVVNGKLGD
ncbi:hypothetical protein [Planktosalinus lacus]|uniref:DUF1761 domain-containing protein n=1 Tax=Planktosalinus lacus TaxID=1526573 RepID=A0A8J2Y996_9FLAO|nr:hypothetical protein [Planktosalinus lacus]GGD85614.1 hypothetical protein GCM10011312_07100 [Planktosalinus lacus]